MKVYSSIFSQRKSSEWKSLNKLGIMALEKEKNQRKSQKRKGEGWRYASIWHSKFTSQLFQPFKTLVSTKSIKANDWSWVDAVCYVTGSDCHVFGGILQSDRKPIGWKAKRAKSIWIMCNSLPKTTSYVEIASFNEASIYTYRNERKCAFENTSGEARWNGKSSEWYYEKWSKT